MSGWTPELASRIKERRREAYKELSENTAGPRWLRSIAVDLLISTDRTLERIEAQDEEIKQLKKSQAEVEERALALLYCLDARDEGESGEDAVLSLRKALSRVLVGQQRGE